MLEKAQNSDQKKQTGMLEPTMRPGRVRSLGPAIQVGHEEVSWKDHIIETLFSRANEIVWPPLESNDAFPEISLAELMECSLKIPLGKAPGPDGVLGMVIKEIATHEPEILRGLFNDCLEQGVFPENWITPKLVQLRKGNKPLDSPSSYRPICLLNTVGKLFERIIKQRLENHLGETNGLSNRQYGFRKGRSTVDAVMKLMNLVNESSTGS